MAERDTSIGYAWTNPRMEQPQPLIQENLQQRIQRGVQREIQRLLQQVRRPFDFSNPSNQIVIEDVLALIPPPK